MTAPTKNANPDHRHHITPVTSTNLACLTTAQFIATSFATGLLIFLLSSHQAQAESFALSDAFPKLTFAQPLGMASLPGDSKRLAVIEKAGRVQLIEDVTASNPAMSTLLDLNAALATHRPVEKVSTSGEQGLCGLAFHPEFSRNGYIYLFYSMAREGQLFGRLARFTVNDPNGTRIVADPESEFVLIEQLDQADNHNGGDLHFGADGYLYVSLGDEGGQNDQYENTQILVKNFFSGLLRIDVDKRAGNLEPNPHPNPAFARVPPLPDAVKRDDGIARYSIPKDNPFVAATSLNGVAQGDSARYLRSEFWAIGLRNPWRFSFDPSTRKLWCGDVGGGIKEEINLIERGGNYGWSWREGTIPGPNAAENDTPAFLPIDPHYEYDHGYGPMQGVSVTGGFVYRGQRFDSLRGDYVFADFASGNVWALKDNGAAPVVRRLTAKPGLAGLFPDPSNGDVLAADLNGGRIYRLEAAKEPPPPSPLWHHDNVFLSDLGSAREVGLNHAESIASAQRLGIRRAVFSCSEENTDACEATLIAAKRAGVQLLACWMSSELSAAARDRYFALFTTHGLRPHIWFRAKATNKGDVEREAALLRPMIEAARKHGSTVGISFPQDGFGKGSLFPPLIAALEQEGLDGIGIVCEFERLSTLSAQLDRIWKHNKTRVTAVTLTGMLRQADGSSTVGLPLAAGDQEMGMMRTILDSGWKGHVGIAGHHEGQSIDTALGNNLGGLDWLARELAQLGSAGPSPNPSPVSALQPVTWEKGQPGRTLHLRAAPGMQFEPRELHAKAGERLSLTFDNPDVMPHNFALLKIGSIERVGDLANKLIPAPDALSKHFIPMSDDILCHTRLLHPKDSTLIHFNAPEQPGSYPYLCTFPGHWSIMRGVLIVK